jgi:predicted AlkP superfamily phosphohydrolase/phosphomutase
MEMTRDEHARLRNLPDGSGVVVTDRLLIVGWDGADWDILNDLIGRGDMPHLREMVETGVRGILKSPLPDHSWAAWPTFLTGMDPGGHGVFDFMERHPTSSGRRDPILSTSIGVETFLESLSSYGHEVRAGNIPVTFPPFPVHGRLIAGGAIPPGAPFVYPAAWADELEREAPFPINGMEWTRYRDDPSPLVEEARRYILERTDSFAKMMEGSWRVAICVFVATDRLQHPFADRLIPSHPAFGERSSDPVAEALRRTYRTLDAQLGRLREEAGDAVTVLVSDHGFAPKTLAADLDAILVAQGSAARDPTADLARALRRSRTIDRFVSSRPGRWLRAAVKTPRPVDISRSVAYCSVTGGGVSLNLKGREPEGIVDPSTYDRVREEIREALLAFEDPELGSPIREVLRSEDVFQGRFASEAPDLIAIPNELWVLDHTSLAAMRLDYPTGDHRRDGVITAAGPGVAHLDIGVRDLADIAPTALAWCDTPPPTDLDGSVIEPLLGGHAPFTRPGTDRSVPALVRDSAQGGISDDEAELITQHLRDLGYVDE